MDSQEQLKTLIERTKSGITALLNVSGTSLRGEPLRSFISSSGIPMVDSHVNALETALALLRKKNDLLSQYGTDQAEADESDAMAVLKALDEEPRVSAYTNRIRSN